MMGCDSLLTSLETSCLAAIYALRAVEQKRKINETDNRLYGETRLPPSLYFTLTYTSQDDSLVSL